MGCEVAIYEPDINSQKYAFYNHFPHYRSLYLVTSGEGAFWLGFYSPTPPLYWFYPINEEGAQLIHSHNVLYERQDRTLSGVLADWLEDHKPELLSGATGPTDPAVRLEELLLYLRNRFHQGVTG